MDYSHFMINKLIFFFLITNVITLQAFDVEQVKNEITIELAQDLKASSKNDPILILIGGYPGAGKSTLIDALCQIYDLDVISWDSVRQALLDRHLKGSPYDWEIIEAVNRNLFRRCVQRNVNMAIDVNAYANNIKLFENLLKEEQGKDIYQIVKICLNPSSETLLRRVRMREQNEDIHQGTEKDLLLALNSEYKKIYMNDYSLIIKNDENISFTTEFNIVNSFLKPYLDKQNNDLLPNK